MKRNFTKMLDEQIELGTILPASESERFISSDGRWRVGVRAGSAWKPSSTSSPKQPTDSYLLVSTFHKKRFGTLSSTPKKEELKSAERLISAWTLDLCLSAIPQVIAELVARGGKDLYFQYAERMFEKLLAQQNQQQVGHAKQSAKQNEIDQRIEQEEAAEAARREHRKKLLSTWTSLSELQQRDCFARALERDSSQVAQDKIFNSTIEKPCAALLKELERMLKESAPAPVLQPVS